MELLEAKSIFKIQDKYSQSELDTFYGFEKNLLLQRLSDEATEDELDEAQKALEKLEHAYSVLSLELSKPSAKEEPEKTEKAAINPVFVGAGIGAVVAAAAVYFLLGSPSSTPSPAPTVAPTASTTAPAAIPAPKDNEPRIDSSNYKLHKLPQEESMLTALRGAKTVLAEWETVAKVNKFQLPANIAKIMEEGEDYRKSERYSQAQLAFEDYTKALKRHKRQVENYQSTFVRFNNLKSEWQTLAKNNDYRFSRHEDYTQQFDTVKNELQEGSMPSYSRAVLDQICFIYETTIQRGETLAAQRKEYVKLKAVWEQNTLGSSYYTLTPSIESLLQTADSRPYYAENFEYLQTQVYPRLLNHFKQHL